MFEAVPPVGKADLGKDEGVVLLSSPRQISSAAACNSWEVARLFECHILSLAPEFCHCKASASISDVSLSKRQAEVWRLHASC